MHMQSRQPLVAKFVERIAVLAVTLLLLAASWAHRQQSAEQFSNAPAQVVNR
jgi:hypothetical protein